MGEREALQRWTRRNDYLSRKTFIDEDGERKYLLARLSGSLQEIDIKKSAFVAGNWYRAKDNLKADPANPEALEKAVRDEFDMPYWASVRLGLPLADCNMTVMPQTKTCNVYCPWCFVDDKNKNGMVENGAYFSVSESLDAIEGIIEEKADEGIAVHVMRRSGGEPTLVPWQWTENLQQLAERGLDDKIYFQGETNLTTGRFIDKLQRQSRLSRHFWNQLADYNNFGVLCSFKGTDIQGHLEAIGMPSPKLAFLEEERWYTFDKMVDAGVDAYPFIYDPNPDTLEAFLHKGMDRYGSDFVSKTWVFPLKMYGPEEARLKRRGIDRGAMQTRLDENFRVCDDMMKELVPKLAGHEYKEIPRTDVLLKRKR